MERPIQNRTTGRDAYYNIARLFLLLISNVLKTELFIIQVQYIQNIDDSAYFLDEILSFDQSFMTAQPSIFLLIWDI